LASRSANKIANAIEHRLPQIRVQRADRVMAEPLQVLERAQERVLHDVFGVSRATRVSRQSSPRPPLHRRQCALDQDARGRRVTVPCALEHMNRGVHRVVVWFGRRFHRGLTNWPFVAAIRRLTEDNTARVPL
jgi:hypothetical protein